MLVAFASCVVAACGLAVGGVSVEGRKSGAGGAASERQPAGERFELIEGYNPVAALRGGGGDGPGAFRSTPILFVDDSAPAGGDGASWATAYRDLQQALADAGADPTVTEIRVAAGTYRPDAGTGDVRAAFRLRDETTSQPLSNIRILGGYPDGGGETRDPEMFKAVLSGDLLGDDEVELDDDGRFAGLLNTDDNSVRVITASGTDETVVLDGFVIEGGNNVGPVNDQAGGGLAANAAGLVLKDLTFRRNQAGLFGGGLFLSNSTREMVLEGMAFENNFCLQDGGGLYVQSSEVALRETHASDNRADGSGGVAFASAGSGLLVEESYFCRNRVSERGGALGGFGVQQVTSCDFLGNEALDAGGAIERVGVVANCDFTDNHVVGFGSGGAISVAGPVSDSVFALNSSSGSGGSLGQVFSVVGCTFTANWSHGSGGAIATLAVGDIEHSTFVENTAGEFGGAVAEIFGGALRDCIFLRNSSSGGGAVSLARVIERTAFYENSVASDGGAVAFAELISDSIFVGNRADGRGGAVFGSTTIENVTIVANSAGSGSAGLFNSSPVVIRNSIFWDNRIEPVAFDPVNDGLARTETEQIGGAVHAVNNSILEGLDLLTGAGNLNSDPAFINELGPDGEPGTGDEDLRLRSTSPAIDAGDEIRETFGPIDLSGLQRFEAFLGLERVVDLGAYEARDCDSDGVADSVAILTGLAADCDDNGLIDACSLTDLRLWREEKIITSDGEASDAFGDSIALDGDRIVVGASRDDDNGDSSGSAYVYHFDGVSWNETAKIIASDGAFGDRFGGSIAIAGDRVVVGARLDDDNGSSSGSAYVYEFDGVSWNETAKIMASDGTEGDEFGGSIAIDGDRLVVSATLDDNGNGSSSGSAYVYDFDGLSWNETAKIIASDGESPDEFGSSVAIAGDRIVLGASRDDDNGDVSGSVYVYEFDGLSWNETAKIIASDGVSSAFFGDSIMLEGDRIVVGARGDDDNGTFSGSVYIYAPRATDADMNGIPDSCSLDVCLPDVNVDGVLNGADFNAWLTAFSNGDSAADQNQDGTLNGADFNAWLTNFAAGCP